MTEFYAVCDRDRGDRYAVVALSDQLRPGFTRAYRWVPNLETWVADLALLRDFRGRPGDQVNRFEPLEPDEAQRLARSLPALTARWVRDSYRGEDERLTSARLGLSLDEAQPPPTTAPQLVESVSRARPGERDRLAQLDEPTRNRLETKYNKMRSLLAHQPARYPAKR